MQAFTSGIVHSSSTAGAKGAQVLLDGIRQAVDRLLEEVQVREDPGDNQHGQRFDAAIAALLRPVGSQEASTGGPTLPRCHKVEGPDDRLDLIRSS